MLKKILVPLDGSRLAECVLPYVRELALGCQVKEVVLLRVCEVPAIPADYPGTTPPWEEHVRAITTQSEQQCSLYLGNLKEELEDLKVPVKVESRLGKAVDEITTYANNNEVDLIIMASHGRSGPSKWVYGSVAERVLRATCVPVLMVRAPGCVPGI